MIEAVERPDDPRLSPYAHVGDHGWLRRNGLFVAEGRLLALRLMTEWPSSIHSILVNPSAASAVQHALRSDVSVYVADRSVVHAVTGIDFHRGCLALGHRPRPLVPEAFAETRRVIALEGVANPDNVGGIFRVAAAFGIDGILLDPATADPLYRKALRTSMGAVFSVPFARIDQWPLRLSALANMAGFKLIATSTRPRARPVAAFARESPDRTIVMFGSESEGLSETVLQLADHEVTVPMRGAIDSLNVVVAAGITLAQLGKDG